MFAAIVFEAAYSLGKHVVDGHQDRDLPSLTPILRWKKGEKIAAKNEVRIRQLSLHLKNRFLNRIALEIKITFRS